MTQFTQTSSSSSAKIDAPARRQLFADINWNDRLIGISGPCGSGKTSLLFQKIQALGLSANEAALFSLDDLFFTARPLSDLVSAFYKKGGKHLFLDKVHKYPGWADEVKNLYDLYPDLQIVFAGSSIIDPAPTALSGLATMYQLPGLSYREYLQHRGILEIGPFRLEEILENEDWKQKFPSGFRPLQYFDQYLSHGYYPFFIDDSISYTNRLQQIIRQTVESDMAELSDFDIRNAKKMLQLLYIISTQAPFKPNVSKLAEESKVHRNTINAYLQFLQQAGLIRLLHAAGNTEDVLQKPGKIYLDNTNFIYALAQQLPEKKKLYETFFVNQLSASHSIRYPGNGDFIVDEKYVFEIGGKQKSRIQVRGTLNSYRVLEEADFPGHAGIPLWLFGYLY